MLTASLLSTVIAYGEEAKADEAPDVYTLASLLDTYKADLDKIIFGVQVVNVMTLFTGNPGITSSIMHH